MDWFCYHFLLFFIFSILGWIAESINCSLIEKRIVLNRGFFIGPYCPIYGVGTLCLVLFILPYFEDPFFVFVASAVGACVLEYTTSFLMEKIFNARWWDYSDKPFNLNGRICLETALLFGIGGILIAYGFLPLFDFIYGNLSSLVITILTIVFLAIFVIDFIVSTVIISKFKHTTRIMQDNTNEITRAVRQELEKNHLFVGRLINAFPKLRTNYGDAIIDNIRSMIDRIEDKITKQKKKVEIKLAKLKRDEEIRREKNAVRLAKLKYKKEKKRIKGNDSSKI